MNANSITSNKERKLLLAIAFAAFIFSIAGSLTYSIKADLKRTEFYREQAENEAQYKFSFSGPYCFPDRHPQFLFSIILLVGATFLSICFTKKYLLSFLITVAALSRFVSWFTNTRSQTFDDVTDLFKGVDRVFYNAGVFDLLVLTLIVIILFWQISILLRMLIKTSQGKTGLP